MSVVVVPMPTCISFLCASSGDIFLVQYNWRDLVHLRVISTCIYFFVSRTKVSFILYRKKESIEEIKYLWVLLWALFQSKHRKCYYFGMHPSSVLGSHACIHVFSCSFLLFVRWTSQLDESIAACFFLPSSARRHLKWAVGYILEITKTPKSVV